MDSPDYMITIFPQNNILSMRSISIIFVLSVVLSACGAPKTKRSTLRDIDIVGSRQTKTGNFVKPRSDDEIRKAYANYLKHASKNDRSRITALNRLAQIEFDLSEKLLNKKGDASTPEIEALDDKLYLAKLERSIELLNTALHDYPNAKNNDKTLYQLAKAYDQKGEPENALPTLDKLVKKYPKSSFYIESQFRLAEAAFSAKKYTLAEDGYTNIIGSKKNVVFHEKALYKRGWARFKQEFYIESVDDFLEVIKSRNFANYDELSKSDKNEFSEYFRAIGLSFSYLGGANALNDYFKNNSSFKHLFHTYAHVSDIYLKQQRYNDAVTTLKDFAKNNTNSGHLLDAHLKIIDIWKMGGFIKKYNQAVSSSYYKFNPNSIYWRTQKKIDSRIYNLASRSLKNHIQIVAANYHKEYQARNNIDAYNNARTWYENYLKHYRSAAHKDKLHYLYASLLLLKKEVYAALTQYELAAYNSNIILHKDAAYETISLSSKLHKTEKNNKLQSAALNKLIKYSMLYSQQYPNDKNTLSIIAKACEAAYRSNRLDDVIKLSEFVNNDIASPLTSHINTIRAHSFFKLKQYKEAEDVYLIALEQNKLNSKSKNQLINSLAMSVYYQGKSSSEENEVNNAIKHYKRIIEVAPSSSIAATGLYDAVALTMQNELWAKSIIYIKQFQSLYPTHRYSHEITKKLSVAYLNSKQDIKAARELEKVSRLGRDEEFKMAALWKAGELYETRNDFISAIRSYEQYARNFPRPFPQHMEAMHKLLALHATQNNEKQGNTWRNKIIRVDRKTPASLKTDRTKLIASTASLDLAKNSHIQFSNSKLVLPLKRNLRRKKTAMQTAVKLYGRASAYGVAETATEATYSIAEIYRNFSIALLESERPKHLKGEELAQYQVLLEDQAFPFEEKAVEFYETNLSHVKDGIYDEWLQKSHAQLKIIFPVRYNREVQLDRYINVLH